MENKNLKENNEEIESIIQKNVSKTFSQINQSENLSLEENVQKSEKDDNLKQYTSFEINAFFQILINKKMPFGYKLESGEILLKKDEKKQIYLII